MRGGGRSPLNHRFRFWWNIFPLMSFLTWAMKDAAADASFVVFDSLTFFTTDWLTDWFSVLLLNNTIIPVFSLENCINGTRFGSLTLFYFASASYISLSLCRLLLYLCPSFSTSTHPFLPPSIVILCYISWLYSLRSLLPSISQKRYFQHN